MFTPPCFLIERPRLPGGLTDSPSVALRVLTRVVRGEQGASPKIHWLELKLLATSEMDNGVATDNIFVLRQRFARRAHLTLQVIARTRIVCFRCRSLLAARRHHRRWSRVTDRLRTDGASQRTTALRPLS